MKVESKYSLFERNVCHVKRRLNKLKPLLHLPKVTNRRSEIHFSTLQKDRLYGKVS